MISWDFGVAFEQIAVQNMKNVQWTFDSGAENKQNVLWTFDSGTENKLNVQWTFDSAAENKPTGYSGMN